MPFRKYNYAILQVMPHAIPQTHSVFYPHRITTSVYSHSALLFGVMLHRRSYAWNIDSDTTYDGTIHHTVLTCAKQVTDYIDVHFATLWREEKNVSCSLEKKAPREAAICGSKTIVGNQACENFRCDIIGN